MKNMTPITSDAPTRAPELNATHVSVSVLTRASGAQFQRIGFKILQRTLEPSVRIASIYFETEQVSLREVFEKTGSSSLMELVNREHN